MKVTAVTDTPQRIRIMPNHCLVRDLRQFEHLNLAIARARRDGSDCREDQARLRELKTHLWRRHPYYMNRTYGGTSLPRREPPSDFFLEGFDMPEGGTKQRGEKTC